MAIPPSPTQWSRIHHCSLIVTWDFGCRVARVNAGLRPKAGSCRFGSTKSTIFYPLSMTIRIPIPSLTAPYAPQCGARPAGRAPPQRAQDAPRPYHRMGASPAARPEPPERHRPTGRRCLVGFVLSLSLPEGSFGSVLSLSLAVVSFGLIFVTYCT